MTGERRRRDESRSLVRAGAESVSPGGSTAERGSEPPLPPDVGEAHAPDGGLSHAGSERGARATPDQRGDGGGSAGGGGRAALRRPPMQRFGLPWTGPVFPRIPS